MLLMKMTVPRQVRVVPKKSKILVIKFSVSSGGLIGLNHVGQSLSSTFGTEQSNFSHINLEYTDDNKDFDNCMMQMQLVIGSTFICYIFDCSVLVL